MYRIWFALLFLLAISSSFYSPKAQGIIIDAIELNTSSLLGSGNLPSYSNFIKNTNSPALFRTRNTTILDEESSTTTSGLSIDFIFRSKNNESHQFLFGFEAANFTTNLYEVQGSFQDTISVTSTYTFVGEHFFLRTGYNYVRTPHKKFSLQAGAMLQLGIPISARTEENIEDDELLDTTFSFFAKQSSSIGLSIPLGIRFKVIKNISFALTSRPTFHFTKIDGTPLFSTFRGTNLSFHFKFRGDS